MLQVLIRRCSQISKWPIFEVETENNETFLAQWYGIGAPYLRKGVTDFLDEYHDESKMSFNIQGRKWVVFWLATYTNALVIYNKIIGEMLRVWKNCYYQQKFSKKGLILCLKIGFDFYARFLCKLFLVFAKLSLKPIHLKRFKIVYCFKKVISFLFHNNFF